MHDSMMIAEVGVIEKVSGNRMATPFAPPNPGSTPISTPRVMPTSIKRKFCGVRTTANPWNSALTSSIWALLFLSYFGKALLKAPSWCQQAITPNGIQ